MTTEASEAGRTAVTFRDAGEDGTPLLKLSHSAGQEWSGLRLHVLSRSRQAHMLQDELILFPQRGNETHAWFALRQVRESAVYFPVALPCIMRALLGFTDDALCRQLGVMYASLPSGLPSETLSQHPTLYSVEHQLTVGGGGGGGGQRSAATLCDACFLVIEPGRELVIQAGGR